jgi:hypothetical protein
MIVSGYFSGVIIYITRWYCRKEHTMRIAIIFGASIASCALSAILVCTDRSHFELIALKIIIHF